MKVNKQAYYNCKNAAHIIVSTAAGGSAAFVINDLFYGKSSITTKAMTLGVSLLVTAPLMLAGDMFITATCPLYAKLADIVPGAESLLGLSDEKISISLTDFDF